jgi:hypothetical protein
LNPETWKKMRFDAGTTQLHAINEHPMSEDHVKLEFIFFRQQQQNQL